MQRIIIGCIAVVFLLLAFKSSNNFTVSGNIIDKDGNPVPFAIIKIKDSRTGVTADANGVFTIQVPDESTILEITATGFAVKAIQVGQQRNFTIALEKLNIELQEVVVTGAAGIKQHKRSMPTNASVSQQFDQSLAGKVAGTRIRSNATIMADENYLYDKDGLFYNREGYDHITENAFRKATDDPLSTFSIDVDAASYSNVRRFLKANQLPPAGAVRIEELINYFKYEYPQPLKDQPFSVSTEIAACPWNNKHRLAMIGMQGKSIPVDNLPSSNIVFLIDVSGSMGYADKLPLVQQSMKLLTDQLREKDKVAICVYAGNAGLVLPATNGIHKQKIKDAIDALEAGGSTAGGEGIQLAYKIARENFVKGGNNRVILCTDGDFNVGVSSDDALERLIEKERASGVFLTVLGYGTGNYQDAKMQKLADKGNGNHAYIDQLSEAKKVLVSEFGGTLFTIAKDVKLQIEFNPSLVQGYRLIGYENRMLNKEDFNDDKKDAGEMGSGHTVTALYEIIPVGVQSDFLKKVDSLKYQQEQAFSKSVFNKELMTVKLRYKQPDGDVSQLMEVPVLDQNKTLPNTSPNFRFAAAVAEFGMLLRNSSFKQQSAYKNVIGMANSAIGTDKEGHKQEFVQLVKKASSIARKLDRKKNNEIEDEEDEDAVSKNR